MLHRPHLQLGSKLRTWHAFRCLSLVVVGGEWWCREQWVEWCQGRWDPVLHVAISVGMGRGEAGRGGEGRGSHHHHMATPSSPTSRIINSMMLPTRKLCQCGADHETPDCRPLQPTTMGNPDEAITKYKIQNSSR